MRRKTFVCVLSKQKWYRLVGKPTLFIWCHPPKCHILGNFTVWRSCISTVTQGILSGDLLPVQQDMFKVLWVNGFLWDDHMTGTIDLLLSIRVSSVISLDINLDVKNSILIRVVSLKLISETPKCDYLNCFASFYLKIAKKWKQIFNQFFSRGRGRPP